MTRLSMPTMVQRQPVQVRGAQAYSANGRFRVAMDDIQPLSGAAYSYLAGLEFAIDVVAEHDNGSAVNFEAEAVWAIIDSIILKAPGSGQSYLNFPRQAGLAIHKLVWAMSGKRPPNPGTTSVPNGGTATIRLKLFIPFSLTGGIEPDDFNVALDDLRGAQIQGRWANADAGGNWDSGTNNERATSATQIREVTAVLVGRHEYRTQRWTMEQTELSGLEEEIPVNQCRLHTMIEIPVQATGQVTATYLTDANRDEITLTVDGHNPVDRIDAIDMCTGWNHAVARETASELTDHESNTTPFVPIVFPHRGRRKQTHSVLVKDKQPKLRVDGTEVTPELVLVYSELNKVPAIIDAMRRAKVPVDPAFKGNPEFFLSSKAQKGTPPPGPAGIQSLPVKHAPQGDPTDQRSA